MKNFDIKQFLTENKLTPQSKQINEFKSDIHLSGDFEGDRQFKQKLERPAKEFSLTPCDPITVDKVISEWDDDTGYLRIDFSNGDYIEYEINSGKSTSSMKVLGRKSSNDSLFLKHMDSTDSPTYTALNIYEKLVKNLSK